MSWVRQFGPRNKPRLPNASKRTVSHPKTCLPGGSYAHNPATCTSLHSRHYSHPGSRVPASPNFQQPMHAHPPETKVGCASPKGRRLPGLRERRGGLPPPKPPFRWLGNKENEMSQMKKGGGEWCSSRREKGGGHGGERRCVIVPRYYYFRAGGIC